MKRPRSDLILFCRCRYRHVFLSLGCFLYLNMLKHFRTKRNSLISIYSHCYFRETVEILGCCQTFTQQFKNFIVLLYYCRCVEFSQNHKIDSYQEHCIWIFRQHLNFKINVFFFVFVFTHAHMYSVLDWQMLVVSAIISHTKQLTTVEMTLIIRLFRVLDERVCGREEGSCHLSGRRIQKNMCIQ